jgi:signal transduction histidine kinase
LTIGSGREEANSENSLHALDRQNYQDLFMLAPEPYLVTDSLGVVLIANLAARRFLNFDFDALRRKPLQVFLTTEEARSEFRTRIMRMIASDFFTQEFWLKPNHREPRCTVLSGLKTITSAGHSQILWLIKDVTDRVRTEALIRETNSMLEERVQRRTSDLKLALESLQRANAAKDEFLGLMSHELRTPLTVIMGNALVLQSRPQLDPNLRQQAIDDIVGDAERLQQLIENLMVLARLDSRQPDMEPIRLQHLIPDVLKRIPDHVVDGRLSLSMPWDLPLVQGSDTYCEQILKNLIHNALKYGGCSPVEVLVQVYATEVAIAVRDHGPGIPEPEVARVFEPFFRGTGGSQHQGAGVGLAVCKRLVEIQGGEISVLSSEGSGTEFRFTLPVASED